MEHRNIPAGQVGVPYNWRVANEAARNALVVSSDDVGKLLQQDDNGSVSYWTLWAASPADWRPISGAPGAPGESFDPDEIGPIANRGSFDNEPPPFSYLADDEGMLYFRIGEAGNWSEGISFGQGPAGEDGAPGPGVAEGGTGGQFLRKVDGTDFNTYWGDVSSADVGLESFDGLTPATLPISTATQTALDAKANSSAVTTALDGKVDKVSGYGLSQENFTPTEKTKLGTIATGATANATDASLRDRSTHTGTQAISTVTGLQSALDDKASNSALSAAVSTLNTAIGEKANSTDVDQAFEDIDLVIAGKADKGAIGSSGLIMSSARLLGRSTASSGAVEEISLGAGLSLASGTLSATALQSASDRQNIFLSWIYQSKLYAGYRRGINLFADGYKAADGINAGLSSNYLLNTTTGFVSPSISAGTQISQGTGSNIGNMTANGGLAAAFDGNTSQVVTACAVSATASSPSFVGKNYSASPQRIFQARTYGSSDSGYMGGGLAVTLNLRAKATAPANPADGTLLGSVGPIPDTDTTNMQTIASNDANTSWSYVWIEMVWSGSAVSVMAEVQFFLPSANNLTVVSTAQTISTSTKSRALIEYDNVASPVINTDITIELSANNGTNWTSAALSAAGSGQSGRLVAETAEVTVAAGASLVARVKTLNNKNIPIHGLAITTSA